MKFTSFTWSVGVLQFLAWLNIIGFVILLGMFLYGSFAQTEDAVLAVLSILVIPSAIAGLITAIIFFITAKGLLLQKEWAKYTTIIIGVLMLFGFPIGTAVGILFIYGMTKGWPEQPIELTNKTLERNS